MRVASPSRGSKNASMAVTTQEAQERSRSGWPHSRPKRVERAAWAMAMTAGCLNRRSTEMA